MYGFVFKNQTQQNRNDENYNQNGMTVKINTNHEGVRATAIMLRSIAASSSWRTPVIAENEASEVISGASSEQLRACSDILSHTLSGRPHQSQQPNFKALSSRAIFIFLCIRLSFLHKTQALSSLFSNCHVKNLRVFMSHNLAGVHKNRKHLEIQTNALYMVLWG